jgi:hypothetical protein
MFNVLILHILARRLNGRRAEIPILGLSSTTMHDASIETYISFSLEISRPKVPSASSSLGRSVVRSLACIVGNQCRRHFLPFECMPSNRFCMPSNVCRRIESTTGLGHSLHDLGIHQCRMPFGCQRLAYMSGVDHCPTYTFSLSGQHSTLGNSSMLHSKCIVRLVARSFGR